MTVRLEAFFEDQMKNILATFKNKRGMYKSYMKLYMEYSCISYYNYDFVLNSFKGDKEVEVNRYKIKINDV